MCAVYPDQDSILQGSAEANSEPVCPGTWSLIGWPLKGNKTSSFAKDVGCPSLSKKEKNKYSISLPMLMVKTQVFSPL